MFERRHTKRLSVELPARYSSSALSMAAWVANLSATGLFLRSDFLDDPGSLVDLTIDLPGKIAAVHLSGEVVRVDERPNRGGMGISIVDLPASSRDQLSKFMKQKALRRPGQG
jgi:hypothetical protein